MNIRYFFSTEFGAGILNQLKYVPRAILFMVILVPAFMYFSKYKETIIDDLCDLFGKHWSFLFLLYLSYLLISTVFARRITNPFGGVFDQMWFKTDKELNAEIIQNFLLLAPYSFLFLKTWRVRKPFISCIALCFITSVTIEILQLVMWLGVFQLSDIIYNTLGGGAGWLVWRLTERVRTFWGEKKES